MATTAFKRRTIPAASAELAVDAAALAPIISTSNAGTAPPVPKGPSLELAEQFRVGMTVAVPLHLIKSNPRDPRRIRSAEDIDEIGGSMKELGQQTPATGYVEGSSVVLIAGETRLRGARNFEIPTLLVLIVEKPTDQRALYQAARAENVHRNPQTVLDDALVWTDLLADSVYPTQVALATALGIKEDLVSRTLGLAKLPRPIINMICEDRELVTLKMLTAIREYFDAHSEEATKELIHRIRRDGLGYRDVVAIRKSAERGPIQRPRGISESVTYGQGRGALKTFEKGGRVELIFKGLNPEQQATVALLLKEALGKLPPSSAQ